MGYRIIKDPRTKHKCQLPQARDFEKGTIIECDGCGKRYKRKFDAGTPIAKYAFYWGRPLFGRKAHKVQMNSNPREGMPLHNDWRGA